MSDVNPGNMQVALTSMANGAAASSDRRISRFDQVGADSAAMWAIAMTSPTMTNAHAMRVANESGSGRTRVESNNPSNAGGASTS